MQFGKHTLLLCCLVLCEAAGVVNNGQAAKGPIKSYNRHKDVRIHKVSFTQKGYIQFLKYIADVPPITDYTFCIWVRSSNLTYSHPLLSYSKHEEERLIRVWISPHGTDINLEILRVPIFKLPVRFVENHWYHVCQSWSSRTASWNFYLNGKLKSSGYEPQLRGVRIKSGGDVVVAQEYTDFNKGLQDGIEGDIFGFNFVLSPTSSSVRRNYHENQSSRPALDVPDVLGYFSVKPNRKPKGYFGFFEKPVVRAHDNKRVYLGERVNDIEEFVPKTTGMKLVELSYNCFLGKGAPVSGKAVLISWTKTPVRVFGGAILKNVLPFCT